ncbi:uncharacterized protein J4E87_009429 [Alternaria ethzedia]|uniref:uncharacterized protein n=1 Tax=Alternaria ethzedia TaxID=181014 RepID=UPI0020C5882C|nr:uncharacterized protein J4E87_009429 [Alternaria ethzedia]KAI4614629.1 hypothetical protein J4E87_009429 [Alternaria ethzedia]
MHVHEREKALTALTAELSPYEWRTLHATTSSRTFQFDVIGNLPVELVAQVFSHLDVAAPYRLQSVSRRWNHTLQSLHVIKASLDSWYQGTVNFQDADHALCQKKARKIHAFRSGKPRKVYKIKPEDSIDDIYLAGNSLIWQSLTFTPENRSRNVCVLDLATWDLRFLGGEGRERIEDVFVSNEIVALTTWANICYVHELHGKRGCKKFRVPNNNYFASVACRERTVACYHIDSGFASVYIWEYDSQRGRSFDIKFEPGNMFWGTDVVENESLGIAPIIQPATQTIILFANAARNNDVPFHQQFFAFGRYTYSGECLSTHHANLHGVTSLSYFSRDPNTFVPVDDKQNILSIVMRDTNGKSSFLVRFNEEEMDMSVWEGSRLYEHPEYSDTNGAMAWWKDTCYAAFWDGDVEGEMRDTIALMDRKADKHDMNAVEDASNGRAYKPIVSESTDDESLDLDINAPVVMNENYVIRNAGNRFYILCFDDDDEGRKPQESGSFFDQGELEVLKGLDTWFDQPHYKGWLQSRPYARVKEIWGPELERRRQELSLRSESD